MKLHLPTALRRALLAITALLSPAVVTTTLATATLASISAPAMADNLTLSKDLYEIDSDQTYGIVTTGKNSVTLQAEGWWKEFKAYKVIVNEGHTLNLTAKDKNSMLNFYAGELYVKENATINITAGSCTLFTHDGYNLHSLLNNVRDGGIIISQNNGKTFSLEGAGATGLTTSFISPKFGTNTNDSVTCLIYITEGQLTIDSNMNETAGPNYQLIIGTESAGTATITSAVNELTTSLTIGDFDNKTNSTLQIDAANSALSMGSIYLSPGSTMVSNRDLIFQKYVHFYNNNTITLNGNTTFYGETYVTHRNQDNACTLTSNGKVTVAEGAKMQLNRGTKWNIGGIIENKGTLIFDGSCTMNIVSSGLQGEYACTEGSNGYRQGTVYTVLTGTGTITGITNCTWLVDSATASYANGKVTVDETRDYSVYYVKNGVVKYDKTKEPLYYSTTKFSLEGGSLELGKELINHQGIIAKTAGSSVEILSGTELKSNQVSVEGSGSVVLSGGGSYTMANGTNTLGTGVSVGEDWTGTVNTTGNTTALELDKLGVNGSNVVLGSNNHTLAARDQSVAANLTSTGSISLTGNKLTLSGTNELGSLNVGSLEITGGSTEISNGLTTGGDSSVATGATLNIKGNSTLGGKITNNGTLNLSGTINVDSTALTSGTRERYSGGDNGYKTVDTTYTVLTGNAATGTATWKVGTDSATYKDGLVIVAGIEDTDVYYVRNNIVNYDTGAENLKTESTKFSLEGGSLELGKELVNDQGIVAKTADSSVKILSNTTLKSNQVTVEGSGSVVLSGGGSYTMANGTNTLGTGVSVGEDWTGTVNTTGNTTALELDKLGVNGSKVELGSNSHTLAARDQSVAANLTSTGSISLVDNKLTLSGTNELGSLNVDSLEIAGGSTTITDGLTTGGDSSVATGATLTVGGNSTLGGKISNSGTLNLSGNITILKDGFAVTTIDPHYQQGSSAESMTSGFISSSAGMTIQVVEGYAANATGANWSVTGVNDGSYTFDEATGELHVLKDKSLVETSFYINTDDTITYDQNAAMFKNINGKDATGLVLNGGNLVLSTDLLNDTMKITANKAGTVEIGNGVTLDASQLNASQLVAGSDAVTLTGKGTYILADKTTTLDANVKLGSDWSGTLQTSGDTNNMDLEQLAKESPSLDLGSNSHTLAAQDQSVTANLNSTGSISLTDNKLTLSGTNNKLGSLNVGSLEITGGSTTVKLLTTGGESSVATGSTLNIDGDSSAPNSTSTLGGKITNNGTLNLGGNITIDYSSFAAAGDARTIDPHYQQGSSAESMNSGFKSSKGMEIQVVEGNAANATGANWSVTGGIYYTFDEATGKLHVVTDKSRVGTEFYINDDITYVKEGSGSEIFTNINGYRASELVLNGGDLKLSTDLHEETAQIKVEQEGTVEIGEDVKLNASQLAASDTAAVELSGKGTYTMANDANTLGSGVSVGSGWSGTVNTTGNTTALALDTLGVNGSKVELGSNSHTLADRDQSVAANLNSAGSISLTGHKLTLSGTNKLGSVSVGSLEITGGSTEISNGLTTDSISGTVSVTGGTVQETTAGSAISTSGTVALEDVTLGAVLNNSGTLSFAGNMTLDTSLLGASPEKENWYSNSNAAGEHGTTGGSGFRTIQDIYTVVTGTAADNTASWKVDNRVAEYADGKVLAFQEKNLSTYWVNTNSVISLDTADAAFTDATATIALNGGTLLVDTDLKEGVTISSTKDDATGGTVNMDGGTVLSRNNLKAAEDRKITLTGSGAYLLEDNTDLGAGVELSSAWTGTVYTGVLAAGTPLDAAKLGTDSSTLHLGNRNSGGADVELMNLKAANVGNTVVPGALKLTGDKSTANNLEVQGMLTLGTDDSAAKLEATGVLSTQGITLGNIGSSAYAAKLNDTALNLTVADSELLRLTGGSTTVLTLGEAYNGETTLNGEQEVLGSNGKMIYSLAWQTPLSRAAAGSMLVLTANTNPTYVQDKVGETVSSYTHHGRAGLSILNDAYAAQNPQFTTPGSALSELIDAVDAGKMTDECLAAVAGASTAALGMALSGDAERQLSAIRNRSMTGNTANTITLASEKPGQQTGSRFFAWVNAEGNRAEQDADSTAAGYTLTSWGGTLGAGMQVNDKLTLGLALTAMYGDLQSDAPDSLKGDMDTTYVSAFARYNKGKWSHAFIGTVGSMEADYKRTVSHAAGSYNASGDTDGTAFGLMYEVSRSMQLSNRSTLSPVFNISYRHTEVNSYSESGADAALNVGKQSLDTVTAGAGARYAAVVGQRMLNRACGFEARALVKYDLGDRQSTTSTGFTGYATRAGIESAELGAFGVELGAGISVPVRTGSIFADGAVELRSDYTNFNATVGYRIQF